MDVKFADVNIPVDSESFKIESELLQFTEEMNRTPLKVNRQTWENHLGVFLKLVEELTDECRVETGNEEFRPNSPSDCSAEFEKRGFVTRRTKTGRVSVDKDALKAFARKGDALAEKCILAREAISKLSQIKSWEQYAVAGSVQCFWDQFGTPMARYSCDNPNLQNRVVEVRETVEPDPGFSFGSLDVGQAEYRVWASLSKDPVLSAAFAGGKDFHEAMARELMDEVPGLEMWGEKPRPYGKTVNFALLYGMQPAVLAAQLGCSAEVATKIIRAYEKRAEEAVLYKLRILADAKKNGKVATKFGRERIMPAFRTAVWPQEHELSKTAWHHHNSGTAAELVKKKTVRMMKAIRAAGYGYDQVRIALQMHDEIILMIKDEILEPVMRLAKQYFCQDEEGFIEFAYEVKTGKNWLEISK